MRGTFFFEMFEIKCKFQKCSKKLRKIFSFLDNLISIVCREFSLLQKKYFSSGVNVLTNGLKASDITKKDFFKLKFPQNDEQS